MSLATPVDRVRDEAWRTTLRPRPRRSLRRAALLVVAVAAAVPGWTSPADGQDTPPLALTESERAWLDAHPRLRLAPDPDFPPFEHFDAAGGYRGIVADFVAIVEERLQVEFEIVRLSNWDEVLVEAEAKEIDVLGAVVETPRRAEYLRFTAPHIRYAGRILSTRDVGGTLTLEQLHGKKVAVVSGYVWQELIAADHPEIELVAAPDITTALQMTSFGIVEAMVSDQATATWYIEQEALTNLRVAGRTPYEQGMSMGVRDDWPELQSILDKAVASITPEERAAVMGRWIVLGERSIFRTRGFWLTVVGIGGVVGLGVGGILLWNRVLRRQVAVRTEALHEELVRRRDAEEALRRHRDELEDTVAQRTAELREAMRQAESANLAKSAFLSNMSHELRTPLNGVLGYAQVLRRDRQVTAGQQKSLEAIESCGHHLLTLINDVLDLSKIEAGRLEIDLAPCDLHRLLTGVDAITRPRAENKQLGLELDVSPEVPRGIVTDGTKLKQVLVNLVGNSIKFTSEGTVRVHVRETENGELEFRVQDTGIGMTDEELAEVFDPFKQAEGGRTSGGTGLGLPISKRIVEALGGSVTVESTKGAGSTFTIVHPLEEVEDEGLGELMEASLSAGVGATLAPGQDVAVLVVDDNRTNRDVLVTLLTDAGFEATEARDGAEALRILRDVRMPLVLMDIRMAGMNGLEATRAIREDPALAGTVVIAVTASVFPEFQNRASESGFDDFITKPFLVADLFARIRRHLDVVFVDPDDGAEPAAAAAAAGLGGLAPAVIRDLVPRLEAGLKVSNVSALIAIADELEAAPETAAAGALVREMTNRFAFDELKREVAELNARLEAGE